eukprot:gene647-2490_t
MPNKGPRKAQSRYKAAQEKCATATAIRRHDRACAQARGTLETSLLELVSTLHSRDRRQQRDISKRDLKAAVKHGKKTPGMVYPAAAVKTWKYEYDGIIFVTDEASKVEITCWVCDHQRLPQ